MENGNKNKPFENRIFNSFEVKRVGNYTLCNYVEHTPEGIMPKLSRIEYENMNEIELLKGNFKVEDIVLNGKRIIISLLDNKTGQKKFGVIESQEGNICIDCSYSSIKYDRALEKFFCSNTDDELLLFDADGFIFDGPSAPILSRTLGNFETKTL